MKALLITSILFNLLFVDKSGEQLTGVRVETENKIYYSNLDGKVSIPENEKVLKINYISYENIECNFTNKDTTIVLNSL